MGAVPCYVLVLAVLLGATVVLAAKPGPNNIRYPDEIVYPKVKCVKEGVFPHPRNCSWYYRCVDRMSVGYYWTYYFECEPGTVFSDDLDQCIHPFLAKPPCGVKDTTPIVTPTPTPSTPSFIPCHGVDGTCRTYEVCLPTRRTRLFCDKIKCPLRTPELSCAEGYSFDMDERLCARTPAESTLCRATTTIDITEKDQVLCSGDNLRPKSSLISSVYCKNYSLCDGSQFKGQKELCRSYYECQWEGAGWTAYLRSCPIDLLYNYDLDKCEPTPREAELCKK